MNAGLQQAQARIASIQARIDALASPRTVARGVVGQAWYANTTFQAQLGAAIGDRTQAEAARPASTSAWAQQLPAAGRRFSGDIEAAADRNGLDPRLLAALVWTESGFDPGAVSDAGAVGLAQLMPATAAGLGVDANDPQENLDGGARFLRDQIDRFGRLDLALAAYNAGPNRVAQAGGVPHIAETEAYVPRVLERYEQLKAVS